MRTFIATDATIDATQKRLRGGEFCAHDASRQYRRYGYVCERAHDYCRASTTGGSISA
jgi:hypothetical protein